VRERCGAAGLPCDIGRAPHIEVLRRGDKSRADAEALAAERAGELEGRVVSPRLEVMNGKAVVVPTGAVSGYGSTHLTLVYFRDGVSAEQLAQVHEFAAGSEAGR
jgi:hypothetical protein